MINSDKILTEDEWNKVRRVIDTETNWMTKKILFVCAGALFGGSYADYVVALNTRMKKEE